MVVSSQIDATSALSTAKAL